MVNSKHEQQSPQGRPRQESWLWIPAASAHQVVLLYPELQPHKASDWPLHTRLFPFKSLSPHPYRGQWHCSISSVEKSEASRAEGCTKSVARSCRKDLNPGLFVCICFSSPKGGMRRGCKSFSFYLSPLLSPYKDGDQSSGRLRVQCYWKFKEIYIKITRCHLLPIKLIAVLKQLSCNKN